MATTSDDARINEMIEAVMGVARGDLSFELKLSKQMDQLDSLAMGLNMMIDDIRANVKKDKKFMEELEKAYQMLRENQEASLNIMEDLDIKKDELETLNAQLQQEIAERSRIENLRLKLLKELELKNKELKDFAYIVSHDLKAPLRGISSLAEWLAADYSDKLDKDGNEQLKLLLNRVKRMHNLIDGILHYSKIGHVKEDKQQVDLNKLMEEIIDTINPPENVNIDVMNKLPTVLFEPTRIGQVFQNLISNAVKYMDKPEGKITIDYNEDDNFWTFSVADNGPGIEDKYHDKIFQIFQTLNPRDEVESTGIGLTIVKKIIDSYGGKIWLESKPGEGTTFFFTNPKFPSSKEMCSGGIKI